MTSKKMSICIVDDNRDFCLTLVDSIASSGRYRILPPVHCEAGCKSLLAQFIPDVILLDMHLTTERGGLELLRWIHQRGIATKPVILTVSTDEILDSYLLGAKGYVTKNRLDSLDNVIIRVLEGKDVILPDITSRMLMQMQGRFALLTKRLELNKLLSEREIEVLRLLRSGISRASIAAKLFISESTVKRHVENILGNTGTHSMQEVLGLFGDVLSETESSSA